MPEEENNNNARLYTRSAIADRFGDECADLAIDGILANWMRDYDEQSVDDQDSWRATVLDAGDDAAQEADDDE